MTEKEKIIEKFKQLIEEGNNLLATKSETETDKVACVSGFKSAKWGANCLQIVKTVYDKNSIHFKNFFIKYDFFPDYDKVCEALGILKTALDDYEKSVE